MKEATRKRTRGPNKGTPWSRDPDGPVSVLRLALDASDPRQRDRIEAMFADAYKVRRALQRDARDRCKAYWRAHRERSRGPCAVRARLGLSRSALEHQAYAHLNAAPHLRRFVTKALAMHLADAVWSAAQRHLFSDETGRRHGMPRVGRWYDFTRLPGRARSHTKDKTWETFRLHGTLAGHRAAYTTRTGDFVQPRRMRPITTNRWWRYDGPLAIVFSGLGDGELVLPVRLPTAPSNQRMLDHHLGDPSRWHKIDLVRHRDPHAVGGWRYEAHLMVLTTPYVSASASTRRAKVAIAAIDRTAGIDVNVSNVTVASHVNGEAMRVTRVERDAGQQRRDRGRARRERRRQRALERSRRAANRAQYQLSKRQEKQARRRAAAGLRPVDVIPHGPRNARSDGVPLQSYRRDVLSTRYHRLRGMQAVEQAAAARARRDRARQVAADLVQTHGYQLVVEDCIIAAWSAWWGRAVAAFSPATLVQAIDREARAVAAIAGARDAGVRRASTRTTALSQRCPCGARVEKRLADRIHDCPACGLRGDRDAVAAVLASFVIVEPDHPGSARVDDAAAAGALPSIRNVLRFPYDGWQDTQSESTDLSARDGSSVTWRTSTPDSFAVARRNVGMASCSTRNEIGLDRTTSDRARVRTSMSTKYAPVWTYLRDTS